MGYLDNETITVDAILTKKGRELISRGDGSFKITQFALGDDEINYNLYNVNHPSGTASFGEAIEAMPIIEAFPDETQILKYKLVTLPRGTERLPALSIGSSNIELNLGESKIINPTTLNFINSTESSYTATLSDSRILSKFESTTPQLTDVLSINTTVGTSISKTVTGTSFNLKATTSTALFGGSQNFIQGSLIIVGNDSGARLSIPLIVKRIRFSA